MTAAAARSGGRSGGSAGQAAVAVAAVFFADGAVMATLVGRVPTLKADLHLSNGVLGLDLLAVAAGSVVALQVGPALVARWGSRPLVRAGITANAASLVLPGVAPSAALLAAALFVVGATNGLTDVTMNAHGVEVERRLGRHIMSRLHAMFSVGGFAGAAAAGLAAGAGWGRACDFVVAGLAVGVPLLLASRWLLPADADRPAADAEPSTRWSPAVLLLGVVAFSCLLDEGAPADWSGVYLHDHLGASTAAAAAGYAVFAGLMAAVRLGGDRLRARFGAHLLVRLSGLLAAAGLVVVVCAPGPAVAVAGFGLLGAGVATVIPIVFAAAGSLPGHSAGVGISGVASLGYLGWLSGPALIGGLATLVGLRLALLLPLALALVVAAAAGAVRPRDIVVGR